MGTGAGSLLLFLFLGLAGSAAIAVRLVRVSRKQNSKRRIVSLKPWAKDR